MISLSLASTSIAARCFKLRFRTLPENRAAITTALMINEAAKLVIIVSGQYKRVLLEGVKQPNKIYVYPDAWKNFSGPEPWDGGGTGSLVKLIQMVGSPV